MAYYMLQKIRYFISNISAHECYEETHCESGTEELANPARLTFQKTNLQFGASICPIPRSVQVGWDFGQPDLWMVSLPMAGGWNEMMFMGPSSPNHSVILYLNNVKILYVCIYI